MRHAEIAFGGKGVGRHSGKAVFVPYTIDGETVSAEIVREKKQFAEAELVEVGQRSPNRVAPPCPYFGHCGGCAYQHIDYSHQLEIKWRQVRDLLGRIGKIAQPPMLGSESNTATPVSGSATADTSASLRLAQPVSCCHAGLAMKAEQPLPAPDQAVSLKPRAPKEYRRDVPPTAVTPA